MYCRNCGKEVDDKAVVCIHCGCAIWENQQPYMNPEFSVPKTGMGVLLGLLLGVLGLVIGMLMYPEGTIARKTFMKSCLITLGVCVAIPVVLFCIYFFLMMGIFAFAW